ncbi:hypothetical protein ABIA30_001282 [Mycobacterium sp. MAA66]|uniref:hypothetical protein n=1 Tax=Mycobacterium sp. MAA66 TaxID=3156297 RepID=UPI003511EB4A
MARAYPSYVDAGRCHGKHIQHWRKGNRWFTKGFAVVAPHRCWVQMLRTPVRFSGYADGIGHGDSLRFWQAHWPAAAGCPQRGSALRFVLLGEHRPRILSPLGHTQVVRAFVNISLTL